MARGWATAILLWTAFANGTSCAQTCPDESIKIGSLQYETGAFNTALVAEFIKRGLGCSVVFHKGETLPLIEQLASGDVDLLPEVWTDDAPFVWAEALAKGKVTVLTSGAFTASEGWYIPKFTSIATHISRVADLNFNSKVFLTNSSGTQGRFINCPLGSQCQIVNSKKLRAYRLTSDFVDFVPESYAAIEQLALTAVEQQQPILFYFWEPSSLINTGQFQKLTEPTFDRVTWQVFSGTADPPRACETPLTRVVVAANSAFISQHSSITELIGHVSLDASELSKILQKMRANSWSPSQAATDFLRTNAQLWHQWIDAATAERMDASLQN